MALPRIRIDVDANTSDAEAGLNRVEEDVRRLGRSATITGGQVGTLSTRFRDTARDSRVFGRGIQNAAFQIGDFATQVGAGTAASIALGQQLPQLFVGFGALGAVIGAVVAIAVPLSRSFNGLASDSQALNNVLGTTAPLFEAIGESLTRVREIAVDFTELLLNNFDRLIIIAGVAAAAFGTRLVAAFVAARVAAFSLAAVLGALRRALIRTGIGAIIIGVGELVYQFTRLAEAAGGFGEAWGMVGAVFTGVAERMRIGVSLLGELIGGVGMQIQGAFLTAFSVVDQAFRTMINGILTGVNSAAAAMNAVFGTEFGQAELMDEGQAGQGEYLTSAGGEIVQSAAGSLSAALSGPLESVQAIRDLLASIRDEEITLPDILGVTADAEDGALEQLDENLTAQEERVRAHFDRIKALTEGGLSDKLGAWGDYFTNLASLTQSGNERLLSIGRAFSAAQALVDAWSAFTQVLRDPAFIGRPWARVAAAGQVLAAGIGAVNAIKQVGSGGSGPKSASSVSSGSTTASVASSGFATGGAAGGRTSASVAIQLTGGDLYSRDQVIQLINAINEAQEDGAVVRLV